MIRILFVDEDQGVLDGFRRVFFKLRKTWAMEFVTNEADARRLLSEKPYDAIVTDIDMPGAGGLRLFRAVKENYPELARVVVSCDPDARQSLSAIGLAHQILVKPIDSDVLRDTLLQVTALRNYLKDQKLKKLINRIESLPSQPDLYMELVQALPSASLKEIGAIVKKDVGMTVKVLQLANSPFLGIKTHIEDIYQAINLIGTEMLKAVALSQEIFSKFKVRGALKDELNDIFNHSCDVADYARLIAMEITGDRTIANDSYMAGMIHDVGKLVILSEFTDYYFTIKEYAAGLATLTYSVEQDILETAHTRIGAYLLGLWGLPELLVETAAYHHTPSEYFCTDFTPVTAVHIADAIKRGEVVGANGESEGNEGNEGNRKNGFPEGLEQGYLEQLGILNRIPDLMAKIDHIRQGA